jgi:hypothetical protein
MQHRRIKLLGKIMAIINGMHLASQMHPFLISTNCHIRIGQSSKGTSGASRRSDLLGICVLDPLSLKQTSSNAKLNL